VVPSLVPFAPVFVPDFASELPLLLWKGFHQCPPPFGFAGLPPVLAEAGCEPPLLV
jgi:hypothetical protein